MTPTLTFVMLLGLGDYCDQETCYRLAGWYFDKVLPERVWMKETATAIEALKSNKHPAGIECRIYDAMRIEYKAKRFTEVCFLSQRLSYDELIWYLSDGKAGEKPDKDTRLFISRVIARSLKSIRTSVESHLESLPKVER